MAVASSAKPRFFATPAAFRAWLAKNHGTTVQLLVGFYKKDSGKPSITWPESVDEALCVGWIDGIRRSLGAESYTIRFTPRKPGSNWSAINLRRVKELIAEERMLPAGMAAYEKRQAYNFRGYAYEQRSVDLPAEYDAILRKNAKAARHFDGETSSYRRLMMWRVVSAMKEETRLKRLNELIKWSAQGKRLPQMDKYRSKKKR